MSNFWDDPPPSCENSQLFFLNDNLHQLLKKQQMILLMNIKLLPYVHPQGSLQNKNKVWSR